MWQVTATQNEEAWLSDYISDIIQEPNPGLPPHNMKIGSIEAHWHEVKPGLAYVATKPGSGPYGQRTDIEHLLKDQLRLFGYRFAAPQVRFPKPRALQNAPGYQSIRDFPGHQFTEDVVSKAQRLVQQGRVKIDRNGPNEIVARVLGDGTDNDGKPDWHQVEIRRDNPNEDAITASHCDCDWGQFQNTPRTRTWQRFQDRPCAHGLAAFWAARSMPLDEDRAPGDTGLGQMSLPGMPGATGPSGSPFQQAAPQPASPDQQMALMPPEPAAVLPPFPGDMQQNLPATNPASVPGQRPGPTPTNPLQYPGGPLGGTFSSVRYAAEQMFTNGDLAQLRYEEQGILQGRSEQHGAGGTVTIPAGSVGEVLGTDPSTGLINLLFMNKVFENNVQMEPFGATVWAWPQDIVPRPNLRKPGPAIRRIPSYVSAPNE